MRLREHMRAHYGRIECWEEALVRLHKDRSYGGMAWKEARALVYHMV